MLTKLDFLREMTFISVVLRLTLAMFFGGMLGAERQTKNRPAGFRTYMLVCVGSCLIMMTNQFIFQATGTGDPTRMSAQVISGIGFLGAGTIVVTQHNQIKGLTTSAGLWTSGVLGLTVGAGFYTVALIGFAALLCSLSFFPRLEVYFKNRSNHFEIYLELQSASYLKDFVATIRELGLTIDDIESNPAYANSGLSVYCIHQSVITSPLKPHSLRRMLVQRL